MIRSFTFKSFVAAIACVFCVLSSNAQQPALLVQRIFANPSGSNDSPFEFIELIATRAINFNSETFTVVFCDGSNASASGWASGGTGSYGFQIPSSAGTVVAGDLIYVGGSSLSINGTSCKKLRQINTGTTAGDGFGTAASAGILGNGGSHADGVAVFNIAAASITSSSVPVDAVFFGTAVGNATGKFKVPANDMYAGGTFGSAGNTALASDPGGDEYIVGTGTFYTNTSTWGTSRSWAVSTTKPNCGNTPAITLSLQNNLTFSVNAATTSFLAPPNISGVVSDPTDPAASLGVKFTVKDNGVDIAAANYTVSGSSSNTSVVPNANIVATKADGLATVKITPTGVGYSTVTLTLTSNSLTKNYVISYASSAAATNPSQSVFHTGISDASAAVYLDDNYMLLSDDENNTLFVFDRYNSGAAVKTFDYSALMNLTDLNIGIPREVDVEAASKGISNTSRIFWLGSMSNQSTGSFNDRPNRNRLFATDISGTGAATTITYIGDYENLRARLISWGTTNSLGLSASATANKDPKQIDGFNVEGMAFAPDNTTMYIGFRAPLLPTSNRINALIAPIQNFESWFGTGTSSNPTFGSPILLNLNGRGIRDIVRYNPNDYVIIAGDYDDAGAVTTQVWRWNGNANDAPYLLSGFSVLSEMNPESVMPVYVSSVLQTNKLEVISDGGSKILYNDATEAKDLTQSSFKKFSSSMLTASGTPLPVKFGSFDAIAGNEHTAKLYWNYLSDEGDVNFEVQRSADGKDFTTIGTVVSIAKGEQNFNDKIPAGEAWYYRIKAISEAGNVFYTNIKMVLTNSSVPMISVYPNPATAQLFISSSAAGIKQLTVRDIAGRVVMMTEMAGLETVINIAALDKGTYLLELSSASGRVQERFIKQ